MNCESKCYMERLIGKLPSIFTTSKSFKNPKFNWIHNNLPKKKKKETLFGSLSPLGVKVLYSLYPELLKCFKKSLCPKLDDLFPNWPNQEFFWKSNCIDRKKHYQLV
jgi:hypothetical protein